MASPNKSLATLRPELGSFFEFDLEMSRRGFIGNQVFTVIEVGRQAGTFGRIKLESLLQARDTRRAPGSGYARQRYEFQDESFACTEHGAEEPVDDRESAMYRDYFSLESVATQRAADRVMRNYEGRVHNAVQAAGGTGTAGTDWTNASAGTPITDVEAGVKRLRNSRGITANALIVSWEAYRALRLSEQVIAKITSAGAGDQARARDVNRAQLSAVFDLDHILVGDAQDNTAAEGQAAAMGDIWTAGNAYVTRVAETNDIREVCCGRTFHWGEDGSEIGTMVESYRDETVRSDVIRARMDTDEKRIYDEAVDKITGVTG